MSDVPALQATGLSKHFGALHVTQDVSLALRRGSRTALIGPNGAGKTTLVNLMTGVLAPSRGTVRIAGEDVTGLAQAARVKKGLARTFQINNLFREMTVLENVYLSASEQAGVAGDLWRPAARHRHVLEDVVETLEMLRLSDDANTAVRHLPYGKQRLVEIAIALSLKPRILLLDEPAAGVPSVEVEWLLDVFMGLPKELSILIIEHDMDIVFRFATKIFVLVQGAMLMSGTPEQIAASDEVQAVYLGRSLEGRQR
jgi:ABC-type branched-subunit amino acid transport system ATPase component